MIWIAACNPKGGIYTCEATEGGALKTRGFLALDRVMYVVRRQSRFYASLRAPFPDTQDSGIVALKSDQSTELQLAGTMQSTLGDVCCHHCVSQDGRTLYAANYRGGTIAVLPLDTTGKVLPAASLIDHRKPPFTAHPHYVFQHNRIGLIAVDLGLNTVFQYDKRQTQLRLPEGSGPRHLVFCKDGRRAYCACQTDGSVYALDVVQDGISIAAKCGAADWRAGDTLAAIRLSGDEAMLYVSARERDSIICYNLDGGAIRMVKEVSCGGHGPRDFNLLPRDRWLYCANEQSGTVTCLRLGVDGIPADPREAMCVPQPLCICV